MNDSASNVWAQFYHVLHLEAERLRQLMKSSNGQEAAGAGPLECPAGQGEIPPKKRRKRRSKVCKEHV